MSQLKKLNGRRQYLVTYSQSDDELFPSRESFGKMIEEQFNMGVSAVKVSHWACCKELHDDGGTHYHCAVKLTGVKKWVAVKERINNTYGIVVNFSDSHDFYLSAYRYVTKIDQNAAHSEGHPNLAEAESPATKKSIAANKRKSVQSANKVACAAAVPPKSRRRLRMSNQDAAMFIRKHDIKTYTKFLSVAEARREEGQTDLSDFIFNRTAKFLHELIEKAWKMAGAASKLKICNSDRLDVLSRFFENEELCVCGGLWLRLAKEVLSLNDIPENSFTHAVYESLRLGRGKFRNIIIIGQSNCAKTFILKPLTVLFQGDQLFENPANHKFGWGGAENAKVIVLQDFRWCKDLITWKDFLLLLEGEKVKLPAPRNLFADDVCISSNVSIFATGISEVKFRGAYNLTDSVEDGMMQSRWKVFKFEHKFKEADQIKVAPCGHCFAKFISP